MKTNELLKYDYISFDIFDTLVKRNTDACKDVFTIVENKYNEKHTEKIIDFYKNRILSEKDAIKKCDKEEITIDDIYNSLEKYYNKEICKRLKEIEKDVEVNVCVPNKPILKIYHELLKKSKNIIITSDMYLDKNTIEIILKKCGVINYKKLYLSSIVKKRKISGSLFDFIISDLKVKKREIVHIGDNIISDFLIPKLKGIQSIHIKNSLNNLFYNKNVNKKDLKEYNTLEKFISNNIEINKDYYYRMGYETFGPILYGMANYLNHSIVEKDKMFFLSRDGYLIKNAFEVLNNNLNTHYFYASRRALIIPTLWKCDTLKEMVDKFYFGEFIKIGNLFKKLGLEEIQFKEILKKYKLNIDEEIKYENLFKEDFLEVFNVIKPIIYDNSKKEYDLLVEYMKQENFYGNVSIIDIGWNGNMQKALVDVSRISNQDINIVGFYLGVVPESKNIGKINMKAFLFENETNRDIYLCEKVINPIFESMFLAPHGSVKKYIKKDNRIEPIFCDYEFKNGLERASYESIQNGALKFISDFKNSDLRYLVNINANLSFYNLMKFAYKPTIIDINKFGNFRFFDEEITFIAKPRRKLEYLKHFDEFYRDLFNSGWKIGFLKKLTKINLFYKQIYLMYIKYYMKKRENL